MLMPQHFEVYVLAAMVSGRESASEKPHKLYTLSRTPEHREVFSECGQASKLLECLRDSNRARIEL